MKQTVLELWRARNSRERWIIIIASSLFALLLLNSLLWKPIAKSRERLHRAVPELRLNAAQVQQQSALAAQLKARAGANAAQGTDLSQAITQAANAAGMNEKLSEVRSTDPGRVSVRLDAVAFDAWINWLTQLQLQYGARLESGQVEALPESGMVKVRAVLVAAK